MERYHRSILIGAVLAGVSLTGCTSTPLPTGADIPTRADASQAQPGRSPTTTSPPSIAGSATISIAEGPSAPSLNGIAFATDAIHGWAGGANVILGSSDGGRSWQRQWAGDRRIVEIHAGGARTAWAVGIKDDRGGRTVAATLLRTADGGVHWAATDLDPRIGAIDLVSATTGWAIESLGDPGLCGLGCAIGGKLVHTIDAGRHWAAAGIGNVGAFCFANERVGYAAGQVLLATMDGGQTWQRLRSLLPPGPDGEAMPSELACSGDTLWLFMNKGEGAGGHVNYGAYRSIDGGRHLTLVLGNGFYPGTPKGLPTADDEPGPFIAPNGSTAIELGTSPAAEESSVTLTHDGARHWLRVPLEGVPTLEASVAFADGLHGWITANIWDHGEILATDDGGRRWREVYPVAASPPVADIAFVSPIEGFGLGIPGDSRVVVRTVDGGQSWEPIGTLPDDAAMSSGAIAGGPQLLSFGDADHGWAISPGGHLDATADGGRTWRPLAVPAKTPFVLGAALASADVGCVVVSEQDGVSNVFLLTTDGGQSWSVEDAGQPLAACARREDGRRVSEAAEAALAPNLSPAQLYFGRDGSAWSDTGEGLARTTDEGATWFVLEWPPPGNATDSFPGATDLSFADASNGWMLANDGLLYRTTDGGNSWATLPESAVPALSVDHPGVTVTPATHLHDGQTVVVRVTGFGVGGVVRLSECASAGVATDLGCGMELAGQTLLVPDGAGAGTATFIVAAHAAGAPLAEPTDRCVDQCVVVATLGGGFAFRTAPISFEAP